MASDQLESTVGKNHHRTADILHKPAEHDIRNESYIKAL